MIYTSSYADLDIPSVMLSDFVLREARSRADHPALVDGVTGEMITYGQLSASVRAGAAALALQGLRPGEVVALMAPNQPRWAVAFHAAVSCGATVAPVNPALTAGEISGLLSRSGARLLIAAPEVMPKAEAASAGTPVELCIPLTRLAVTGDDHGGDEAFPAVPAGDPATRLAALTFSSGTTGTWKPVMLTHRNLVANLRQFQPMLRLSERDVLCAVLPLFHIYGLTMVLNAGLLSGCTIVTLPRYETSQFLSVVDGYRVTRLHLVPPMVLDLARADLGGYDLSSLGSAICGAAPLDEAVAAVAAGRIGCPIGQGYGMTECSPSTHFTPDDELGVLPAGSVGRLMPGTQARIVDPATGLDTQRAGELWIRGPQVMTGYLGEQEATAAAFHDGWLRTGDLASVDQDGAFWIVGRIKELIKYNGHQVAPAELEAILRQHPSIRDSAVAGIPHPRSGQVPKAFVVRAGSLTEEEVMAWVAPRVATFKRVREVEFVDVIPRSASGKILRRLLAPADGTGGTHDA